MATFTTSDGVDLRYEVVGQGSVVVFACQGGPSNISDTLAKDLMPLATDCTLVFHDYRGSGQSQNASPETYTFERLADDLDELRAHLGYDTIAVLAHSMGGFIALNFAVRHPQSCARLALVGTTPTGSPQAIAWRTLTALGPARIGKVVVLLLRFLLLWSWRRPSARRTEAKYAFMAVTQEPRRELRALVAAAKSGPIETDNSTHLERLLFSVDLRAELGQIACPALVLYGTRDSVMVAGGELLTAGLPNCHAHVLADVGHEPFIEAPEETFAALRTFLL